MRTVPHADHVVDVLTAHAERYRPGDGGMISHRAGEPWRRNPAADAMRAAISASGVPASGWHLLRHHAASVLIAEGLGVTAVAATLGHSPAECLAAFAGWWPSEGDQVRSAFSRAWAVRRDSDVRVSRTP